MSSRVCCPSPSLPTQRSRRRCAATTPCCKGMSRTCRSDRGNGRGGPYATVRPLEIRPRRFRHREQIVVEVVGIVLRADELLPGAVLLAPARRHIHGLVERILVLDL